MKEVHFKGGVVWFRDGVFREEPEAPDEEALAPEEPEEHSDSEAVNVGDVMTQGPLTAVADDICECALEALESEDFHHLPVTSDEGVLVGVVSDRDLLENPTLKVGQVMSTQVLIATPETQLHEAAKALIQQRFHCLVVVDLAAHPIGILTSHDILSFLVQRPAFPLWRS
jgi:CBS domain-containing protein